MIDSEDEKDAEHLQQLFIFILNFYGFLLLFWSYNLNTAVMIKNVGIFHE